MSSKLNKHGLSRDIPEDIKRQVRQECGFGCVCCGLAIATYEHIDPEFKDARAHDPQNIAYLCGNCHDRVTRGFWSKQKVKEARENPWCIRKGKCFDAFDISDLNPVVWVGPNEIININKIVRINDEIILAINPPEKLGMPFMISGIFFDDNEKFLFKIINNEWEGNIENWDINATGNTITIRKDSGKVALKIHALPPKGIFIEHADMLFKHVRFIVNKYQANLFGRTGAGVIIQGRRIVGLDKDTVLLTGYSSGKCEVGGGGGFIIEGIPENLPDIIKNRAPIGPDFRCPCGSGLKYKKCCNLGDKFPGRGPRLTIKGIPL